MIDLPLLHHVLELPLFVAAHYVVLAAALATAWLVGRVALARLAFRNRLEAAVVATALGLGLLSTVLFLLALVGFFRAVPILLLALVAHLVWRRHWLEAARAVRDWSERELSIGRALVLTLALVLLAPLAVAALYPPIEFDALMFHLPLADSIAAQHRIDFFSELRYPVFPALQEILYAAVMLFSDDVSAELLHFACFLLVAMILYCWGSWLSSRRAGAWAALLWLGVPAGLKAAAGAYVDCGLALYVAAAVFCLHRYARSSERAWLLAAAALTAFGAATKYHGLFFLVLLSLGVAVRTLWRRRPRHLAAYLLVLAALVLPWYGFIYYHTGNPIFPFFPGAFGFSPWAFELRYSGEIVSTRVETGPLALLGKLGMVFQVLWNKVYTILDRNPLDLVQLPLDIFEEEHAFRGEPLSPLFAVAVPLIGIMLLRFRRARYLMLIGFAYLVIWAATAKDLRYVLVALPFFALTGAEGADRLVRWISRRSWRPLGSLLAVGVTALLLFQVNELSSANVWWNGKPPTTERERERFLAIRLRPYEAIQTLNRHFGADYSLYALFCENMKHFIEGRHLGDWFGPERYARVLGKLQNRDALYQELSEMEVEYLLLPDLYVWKQQLGPQYLLPSADLLAPHFEVFYEDRFTTVYHLLTPEELAAARRDSRASDGDRDGTGAAMPISPVEDLPLSGSG